MKKTFIILLGFIMILCSCKSAKYNDLIDILDYYCSNEAVSNLTSKASTSIIYKTLEDDKDLVAIEGSYNIVDDFKYSYEAYLDDLYDNKDMINLKKKFAINDKDYIIEYNKNNKDISYDIVVDDISLSLKKTIIGEFNYYSIAIKGNDFYVLYDGKSTKDIIIKNNLEYTLYSNGSIKFFDDYKGYRMVNVSKNSSAYENINSYFA